MTLAENLYARCIRCGVAASVIVLVNLAHNACAQSTSPSVPPKTLPGQLQLNSKDSKPNLPGDRGQVGGNDVLKPMTIEQQKEEAQKKSELVDLQKEAYEHAVENMLEAVE